MYFSAFLVVSCRSPGPESGCGSGILSLFAERLGPEHDDALDAIEQAEDAEAIAKATENLCQ